MSNVARNDTWGESLRERREGAGLSADQLGAKAGVSGETIRRIERGENTSTLTQRKIDEARQEENVEELTKWIDQHDGKIMLDKQRFGEGEESEVYTWFHKDSCQFHTTKGKFSPSFEVK